MATTQSTTARPADLDVEAHREQTRELAAEMRETADIMGEMADNMAELAHRFEAF